MEIIAEGFPGNYLCELLELRYLQELKRQWGCETQPPKEAQAKPPPI